MLHVLAIISLAALWVERRKEEDFGYTGRVCFQEDALNFKRKLKPAMGYFEPT